MKQINIQYTILQVAAIEDKYGSKTIEYNYSKPPQKFKTKMKFESNNEARILVNNEDQEDTKEQSVTEIVEETELTERQQQQDDTAGFFEEHFLLVIVSSSILGVIIFVLLISFLLSLCDKSRDSEIIRKDEEENLNTGSTGPKKELSYKEKRVLSLFAQSQK